MDDSPEPRAVGPHILKEGAGVVAVWKPAGLATQAPPGIPSVESWLRARLHGDRGGYLGVPHRLDRAVSGVLLLATTPRAARQLSRQFERRQVRKTYLAVVAADGAGASQALGDSGASADRAATVWHDRIEKVPDEPRARIVPPEAPGGREALTAVRLLRTLPEGRLLLEFEPLTGRMHQLRLQASARGLPILGDTLYGGPTPAERTGCHEGVDARERAIALHAVRIEYTDPETAQRVAVEAPLPSWWPAPQA